MAEHARYQDGPFYAVVKTNSSSVIHHGSCAHVARSNSVLRWEPSDFRHGDRACCACLNATLPTTNPAAAAIRAEPTTATEETA